MIRLSSTADHVMSHVKLLNWPLCGGLVLWFLHFFDSLYRDLLDQYTQHPWKAGILIYSIEIYIIFTQQYLIRILLFHIDLQLPIRDRGVGGQGGGARAPQYF